MSNNCLRVLFLALLIVFAGGQSLAQTDVRLETRTDKLLALSERLKTRDATARQAAAAWARSNGIPFRQELPNDRILELQRYVPGLGPTFYITNNVDAADTVSTDEVWPGGSSGLSLDGSGMTIGEWDGGAVWADHPDLYGRVNQVDSPGVISNHSTHVAGTLIGTGTALYSEARGMAYSANLEAYDWNSDTAEMASAAASGLLVSNHSYGIAAGWIYVGAAPPNQWWWIGGANEIEDKNFGYYDSEAQLWDQVAVDAPYYLIVKAAGNDRWDTGPASGEQYTVIDQDGNPLSTSTQPRNADCAPAGYDCLPTASVAKNILTVGAIDDLAGGYAPLAGPSQVQMTPFSGWGPTDDGRIKPDVVGNGWLLLSTYAEDPYFAVASGTSMAAPNVSGSLLLLQEHYQDRHGSGNFMRAATLKALAIHTADEAGAAPGPDYEHGWGLLNTKAAAQLISDDGNGSQQIVEGSLANGATDVVQVTVSDPDAIVTATLVWMDPPGTPVAPTLDPQDSMLINDLDLRINNGTTSFLPWALNPAVPADPASRGDNFRDNVEQVVVNAGGSGVYTVEVSHKGTLSGGLNQAYSLIISVQPPAPISSGMLIDEDFSGGLPAGWSIDTSWGKDWTIETPVPGDPRYDNFTGGTGNYAMVDNDNANTLTSLRTPSMDLSLTEAVVLRFKSYYPVVHDFESLNIDVSTNEGANWSTVWTWQGWNPYPTQYSLDLTGSTAGHAAAMLRFRWYSGNFNTGDLWQIDDVELEVFGGTPPPPPDGDPPGQASNPTPAHGESGTAINVTLSWSAGLLATSHDVYFGTNSTLDAGDFRGNQTATTYNPGTLAAETTYYWRVVEVNADGTTEGATWSFSSAPASEQQTIHVGDLDASRTDGLPRNRWQAEVTVEIHDVNEAPVADANVSGAWGNGASGTNQCTTDVNGTCTLVTDPLKGNVGVTSYTVTSVTHSGGYVYLASDNHDFDGDSDGTTIDVPREPQSTNASPSVTIGSPVDGATFDLGALISFSGSAIDDEDGDLSANLSWESSIDGAIGSGVTFDAGLSEGNHVISASVVDSVGASGWASIGITVGNVPVVVAHIAALTDASEPGRRGRWTAGVTVLVLDSADQPVANATVNGSWSNGTNGSGQCTTNSNGLCTVFKSNLKSNVASVTYTVTDITGEGISYSSSDSIVTSVEAFAP